ncbi:hypothetical protein Tco_1154997 [Tanacetum coccineum]
MLLMSKLDNNEDIDWTKEFDAEPVTYAMMALTGVEQDDWSIEFDAEHMHFGQDGLDDFDWSNKVDDAPVSLALMATNSEVPYCSKCSKFGIESSNSMESDISSGDETLTDSTYENFKREKAYKAVPPPTDRRERLVKSSDLTSSHSRGDTSAMVKAQWNVGFCAKTLTKEAQCHQKGNDTLAIFRCPHNDPTAYNSPQMIEEMIG